MTTIKQLADELGVSKQAIRKQIAKLPPTMLSTSANRAILINDDGINIIRGLVPTKLRLVTTNQVPTVDTLVDMLQRDLDSKNALIESQSRQLEQAQTTIQGQAQSIQELTAALENTTASLHAAQALHAGTMHKQLGAGQGGDPQPENITEPAHKEPGRKPGLFARLFGVK